MRVSWFLYGAAVVLMPVSYATKSLLHLENILWVDPSLVLVTIVFLLLLPRWGDFLAEPLRSIFLITVGLALLTIPAMVSGFLLRPTPQLYDILREPLRFWLLLIWLLTSCWFFRENPQLVFRCTAIAALFAFLTGLYMYGVVLGDLPANSATTTYARVYFLRQAIWVNTFPIPRMGGLFIEAPPFGLFMFSSTIILLNGWRLGYRSRLVRYGIWISIVGTVFSLTDQVLLGAAVGLGLALPSLVDRRSWRFWISLSLALTFIAVLLIQSLIAKTQQFSGSSSAIYINGSSIGERTFHTRYGFLLLSSDAKRVLFGLGPGRYGEYAAETGYFPDSVTMQFSLLEILCEWGVIGLAIAGGVCCLFFLALWRTSGIFGCGLFFGLLLANSFQSNWKWEGAFLAVAALYTSLSISNSEGERLVL